ncbi:MAG TPA: MlaD family protein [Mariprofundaceae bacterium]|nr:MlaD family protein [Mariprofundaceae bacterium]
MRDFVGGMQRQVGWFVIIGIGAILFVLLMISLRTDVFAKKFYLYVSPPSASGFYVGQPVKFQGFAIGRVGDMELMEKGGVRITLQLLDRYRGMLHAGGVARISKEGLIGEEVVEVTSGVPLNPEVQDGQQIKYETAASIEQLLQDAKPAVTNANIVLAELADLSKWLNDPNGSFRQMTARLNESTKGMNREQVDKMMTTLTEILTNMQALTGELEKTHVAARLSSSLKMTTDILQDLKPLSETIGKKGPETFTQVNALLKHVDKLTQSLDIVAADLSELTPELPGLARESRETITEIRGLIAGMRDSWLFGGSGEPTDGTSDKVAPPVMEMRP